jgi:hypothetical protein
MRDKRELVFGILITIFVLLLGLYVSIEYWKDYERKCDEKFGRGNWKLVDVTKEYGFTLSKVYRCVENGV